MERHQAGQKEALVGVKVEMDNLEAVRRPLGSRDSQGCFKCAVASAAVMGLVIVALLAGFILHFVMFHDMPSCNQNAQPLNEPAKYNITCKPKKSDEYEIFTANKTATYIIYGAMKHITSEEVTLTHRWKNDKRTIQKKTNETVFLVKVNLVNGSRISIFFKSTCTDSSFIVYKL